MYIICNGVCLMDDRVSHAIEEDFNIDYIVETTLNGNGDSDAHLAAIFGIALSIKAKTIVELGVRYGKTTIPLLLAASKNNGVLYSVDITTIKVTPPDDLQKYWKAKKLDAIDFLKQWDKDKVIDLIFIDDFHTYKHVAKELRLITPLITPSSLVLLHDLMYANWEPRYHSDMAPSNMQWAQGGPYRAVNELDTRIWEFSTIPSCNGLTILRKKG